ncbi:hypothetical protein CUR178_06472 [Leishmania enriettii]|uniref:RING-type domain-containing protein n=1 Tax=Leishmania enriettii TaxID=5663 RepID=A0A836GY30_LEIEN|nr:hypothetical protein CUR178_06472 [Leishmania enriettii]
MAGLQSENISLNSTRLPEQSTSDKDCCAFCLRRAIPSASDPHAPLFPFFSLVDCRHYACQPCALVHCDNAGRRILCPKCHCVSRLAQSGRRRTRSAAAATDADADRVSIDDGVSSTRSRRTGTSPTPHRSALKGKSGTSKRRASSVQFPANPTTSVVPGDGASGAASVPAEDGSAGEAHRRHRASSPLTQDAVDALPLDPLEVQRRRAREQQLQLRAAEAAAKTQQTVSLYAITVAPPPSSTSAGSGTGVKAKGRSRSQPAPKLPNTILEPKQEYPPPPPLELHTVDEAETHSLSVSDGNRLSAEPALPIAVASASGAAAEVDAEVEKSAPALVSVLRSLITPPQTEDEVQAATAASDDNPQTNGTLPPSAVLAQVLAPSQQLLDDCESTEAEERGVVGDVETHERAALKQRMEEEDTAIRAHRGLVLEFESTPIPVQQQKPTPHHRHSHHNNASSLALGDLSDQVSATSDDELSQRVSAHKSAASSSSTSRVRQRKSISGSSEPPTHPIEKTADEVGAKIAKGGPASDAATPGDAIRIVPKSIAKSSMVDSTLSPLTTARQGQVAADEESEDYGEPFAAVAPSGGEDARKISAAREAATAAAEAEAQAAAIRAAEDARAVAEEQERAQRRQLQRDAAEEATELKRRQLRREEEEVRQRQLHEERAVFACQSLQDRECLAREALEQAEEAVREHYQRSADEWVNAALPHELEAQRRARAAAEHRCLEEQQQAQLVAREGLQRDKVEDMEANSWSWLLSGARVDRVVAATEEGDRVQREYEELRFERLQLQLREDTEELVHEEEHGRTSFIEYEAATRSLLQSHYAVQRQALAEDEERQEAERFKKALARREAALRQRHQWELDELDADEVSGRAMLREVEREERRTSNLVFLQRLASIRRKELLSQHTAPADAAAAGEEAGMSSVLSDAATVMAAQVLSRAQPRQSSAAAPLPLEEDGVGDDGDPDVSGVKTPPQLRTPLITAKQLSELRAREAAYAVELQAALERLQEAERRVAEEAAIREQAEQERQAVRAESERLLQEAEQRAEQRIREARDSAEQLLQAQLADLRDESVRRAEHAAVMQALAEEEQRAVLEAKLQAAQRQLEEAQQRAQEEVHRAREDAAEMAAADAARAAREAQRREEEWQERCHAEHLLRLAEKESEKEETIRRLAEIEARAAEAVRLAREEAARTAAEAQERLADMERRQQAREAEVQLAAQRVRSARDSLREFDSRSQSSRRTTPSRAEQRGPKPLTSSLRHEAQRLVAASSNHASQASAHTPLETPPLVPSSSHTPSATQPQPSAPSGAAVAAAPAVTSNATPPRVILSSQHTPLSSAVAPGLERGGAAVPSSAASAAGAASLFAMDPADIIRAAIRSAVREIVEAQRRTQTLQDRAEQHVELSERRYHRHQGDRLRAARDVAAIESSYALSEMEESEERHKRRQSGAQQARQRPLVRGREHNSRTTSSHISGGRLYLTRSSHGGYAQEVSDSPWTRSSSSPASRVSPTRAPMPTASSAAAATDPGSVSSHTLLSTSSVYFDSIYRPSSVALGAVHHFHGRYGCDYAAAQQQQQRPISFGSYSAASRVLFAPPVVCEARDARAAEDGEHGYAQGMPTAAKAHAYPRAASRKEQLYATSAAQPPLQQQQPPRAVGVTAALPSVAHAYNEPEPPALAPAAMDYSPPPRRSTTRTVAEAEPQQERRRAGAGTNVGSGGGVGALPEPSRICPRCYCTETTSPCWRCGEMICRRCGLPPGSARQLCCTAHHRAQLREFGRRKAYESGHATTTAAAGKASSPSPLPQEQHQQQRLRGEQQVQTSFASSTDSVRILDTDTFAAAPAARSDAGTSPLASLSPPCMIPPSAYRAPQQQQQRQPYREPSYPSVCPAFTMAGTAALLQQPMYPTGYQSVAAAYPYAYSHSPQQQQLPLLQQPFHVDSEKPHTASPSLGPYAPPFSHPQPPAPFDYSVRAATAALGSAATGGGDPGFAAGTTVSGPQQQEAVAAVAPRAWTAPELPPSASRSAAVYATAMPHAPSAGLAQPAPPPSALRPSHQEASKVVAPRNTQADAIAEPTVPAAAAVDGTPAAQVQRQPSQPTWVEDGRANAKAKPPVATGNRTPPNAILSAAVADSAAASATLPGRLPETQGGATAPADAVSTRDVGGAATEGDGDGDGTSGGAAAAVLEEPKTERKKTFPAFFVSLRDGEGAVEPRRPKPPTPRNFVPSQLIPAKAVGVPPPRKQRRRNSPSGALLISQSRTGGQSGHRQHQHRKLSPLQAYDMNCPRSVHKSVSPSRGFSAQRRQRHPYPSPYARAPNASGARDVQRKAPVYPSSQRQHVHVNGTAASMTKSIKSYIQSLSPVIVVDASGAPIGYEDVRKVELDSCCRPQQQRRPQEWGATAAPAFRDIYLRSGGIRGDVPEAEYNLPATRLSHNKRENHYVDVPSQPHDFSQKSQQQRPCSSRNEPYNPRFTSSGATSETTSQPPHQQHQHRYAPSESHMPGNIIFTAPVSDRRVPTLAELERRLQQLRLEDEHEAAEYHRRQAQHSQRLQHQQHIHSLLHPTGAAAVGGNTRSFVAASSHATREISEQQRRRHNSAAGRHPQLRTVSPPWRTDLNSSPVRPRWDISRPRSPIYHPAPATTAGD